MARAHSPPAPGGATPRTAGLSHTFKADRDELATDTNTLSRLQFTSCLRHSFCYQHRVHGSRRLNSKTTANVSIPLPTSCRPLALRSSIRPQLHAPRARSSNKLEISPFDADYD